MKKIVGNSKRGFRSENVKKSQVPKISLKALIIKELRVLCVFG